MEEAEALIDSIPHVETHDIVRGCLATLPPQQRDRVVGMMLNLESVDLKLYCIQVLNHVFQIAELLEPVLDALCSSNSDPKTLLELHYVFSMEHWQQIIEAETQWRQHFIQQLAGLTLDEKSLLAMQTHLSIYNLSTLLNMIPEDAQFKCSLCCHIRRHTKRYALLRDEKIIETPSGSVSERLILDGDLLEFKKHQQPLEPPSTLSLLGLEEDCDDEVAFNGCQGLQRVDTSTSCRSCRDAVYKYMGVVGNTREIFHLLGNEKRRELKKQDDFDMRRARWWTREKRRRELGESIELIYTIRKNFRRRKLQEKKYASHIRSQAQIQDSNEAQAVARAAMLRAALSVDSKWCLYNTASIQHELTKRTILSSLSAESEHTSEKTAAAEHSQRWPQNYVSGHGLSSKRRQIDQNGVPLTKEAAAAVFGTSTLIVPDETEALRLQRKLASECESELDKRNAILKRHQHHLAEANYRHDLEHWVHVSAGIEVRKQRQIDREAYLREERAEMRNNERKRLREVRMQIREEARLRELADREAEEQRRIAKEKELLAEGRERLAMMFAESEQCEIDRFWGVPTEALRLRRLEHLQSIIWLARVWLCNQVMRKTESIQPFFTDELLRRQPPQL